jgi:PST family polysaccharide transporter
VSEASNSPDNRAVTTVLVALRRLTLLLGAIAAITLFFLRKVVSGWVFSSPRYAYAVGVLSLGVLFTIISSSQVAVLNGLRRVGDIARLNIIGAAIGTGVTILLVVVWRERALVYAVTTTTLVMLICSWWFLWRIPRPPSDPVHGEIKAASVLLLRLGAAFLSAGVVMTVVLLLTRVIIINRLGMASAGYFQAAWGFVVFYIDFILNAMGVDFYPHLTSCIQDRKAANQLVNEQTEVALILGGPLILGMVAFAPVVIFLFYSRQFVAATKLLRWLLLGNIVKIISWPMGYLVMAHGWAKTFIFIELVWASAYLGLVYFSIGHAGIDAAGYAYVGSYLAYATVLFFIVNRFSGFAWTERNLLVAVAVSLAAILVMALVQHASVTGYVISGLITLGGGLYSLQRLYGIVRKKPALS